MKKLTQRKVKEKLEDYFDSRRVVKRDSDGQVIVSKTGEILYEERPCTVTGLALALGMTSREELEQVRDQKVKALIDRALLKIEESAEEKLFFKDTAGGAKLFLATNFRRWSQNVTEESGPISLGVCSVWAE